MNSIKYFKIALCLLLIPTLFVSCSKDDSPKSKQVTEAEAADIIGNSLQGGKGGIVGFSRKFAKEKSKTGILKSASGKEYAEDEIVCDFPYQESFTSSFSRPEGVLFPLESTVNTNWSYIYTCGGLAGFPDTAEFDATTSFDFLTNRITASGTLAAEMSVQGLLPLADDVIINGSFQSSANSVFIGVLRTVDVSSSVNVTLENITFEKNSFLITEGKGTATIYARSGDNDVNYLVDIVFNDDNSATLTINGNVYVIEELIPEEDI